MSNKKIEDYLKRARVTHHERCPKCEAEGKDRKGDNLAVYEDGGKWCFARHGLVKMSETYKSLLDKDTVYEEDIFMGNDFSPEYWSTLEEQTTSDARLYRGIRKEVYEKYGVRHEVNPETREVIYQYYPVTKNLELSGVRWRDRDKKFYRKGEVGADCDLFGQVAFHKSSSKRIVIGCGEIDTLSLYQVIGLKSFTDGYGDIPAVCTTVGEGGYRQLQKHYEWLNTFEKIVVCPDNDDAGQKHLHQMVKYLPKGKVYIMTLPKAFKDVNEMLKQNKSQEILNSFIRASLYSPSGIVGSDVLYNDLYDFTEYPKLTFPPFMRGIQEDMLMGGIEFPSILNFVAPSGIGKSTLLNEVIYHWIMETTYTVGVLALESTRREFSRLLASRHLQRKLALCDPLERQALLEDTREHNKELYFRDNNSLRFYFMEELDGNINRIKELIEQMVIACDCKVIVIDPLQDLFAGLSNEEQEEFLAWLKILIKRYEIIVVCINHIRKQDGKTDQNKMYMESEIMGTSTIIKSSFFTLLMNRNKYLDRNDPMGNVTQLMVSKNRQTGITGPAPSIYYDNNAHLLYEFETYKKLNPDKFPETDETY